MFATLALLKTTAITGAVAEQVAGGSAGFLDSRCAGADNTFEVIGSVIRVSPSGLQGIVGITLTASRLASGGAGEITDKADAEVKLV